MNTSKRYSPEIRERAVRMVLDLLAAPALEALGSTLGTAGLQRLRRSEAQAVRDNLSNTLEGRMILRALSLTE